MPVPGGVRDAVTLRELCLAALGDVPACHRKAVLARLSQMRRADDLWNLREALFSVISQACGHGVARARVEPLEPWLRAAGGAFERRGADGGRRRPRRVQILAGHPTPAPCKRSSPLRFPSSHWSCSGLPGRTAAPSAGGGHSRAQRLGAVLRVALHAVLGQVQQHVQPAVRRRFHDPVCAHGAGRAAACCLALSAPARRARRSWPGARLRLLDRRCAACLCTARVAWVVPAAACQRPHDRRADGLVPAVPGAQRCVAAAAGHARSHRDAGEAGAGLRNQQQRGLRARQLRRSDARTHARIRP